MLECWYYLVPESSAAQLVDSAGLACVLARFAQPALARVQVVCGSTVSHPTHPPQLALACVLASALACPSRRSRPRPRPTRPRKGCCVEIRRVYCRNAKGRGVGTYVLWLVPKGKAPCAHGPAPPHPPRRPSFIHPREDVGAPAQSTTCREVCRHATAVLHCSMLPPSHCYSLAGKATPAPRSPAAGPRLACRSPGVHHPLLSSGFAMAFSSPYLVIQRDGDAPSFSLLPLAPLTCYPQPRRSLASRRVHHHPPPPSIPTIPTSVHGPDPDRDPPRDQAFGLAQDSRLAPP
ncbi:hypothetical protein B0H14DRAFT_3489861 [Mycena olivaceomarginata]|nr:hypothetical protein B0H14DRAFT_3489861 [Mycena olivaceomarginata]